MKQICQCRTVRNQGPWFKNGTHPIVKSNLCSAVCSGNKGWRQWWAHASSKTDRRSSGGGWRSEEPIKQGNWYIPTDEHRVCSAEVMTKIYAFYPMALNGLLHCFASMFIPTFSAMLTNWNPFPAWAALNHGSPVSPNFCSDEELFEVSGIYYLLHDGTDTAST